MNFHRRAENLVRSVLSEHLHKSDLFELLVDRVAEGLQQVQREARRHAIREAANVAGGWCDVNLSSQRHSVVRQIVAAVLQLEKPRPQELRRRG